MKVRVWDLNGVMLKALTVTSFTITDGIIILYGDEGKELFRYWVGNNSIDISTDIDGYIAVQPFN